MSAQVIGHPVLGALLRYWDDKRDGGAMPSRHAIDPLEMGPRLLPHLMLCDLFDRGTRVRFRLVGTTVVKRLGFDPTGQFLGDQLDGDYIDLLAMLHRLVYCERAPLYSESLFNWRVNHRLEVQHLLLPLTNGGPDPAIALLGIVFETNEPFPPQLRQLNGTATHTETHRAILPIPDSSEWQEASDLSVA